MASDVVYSELKIDGVLGDIYDKEAVHNDVFNSQLINALSSVDVKAALLDSFYPVDSLYISYESTNPGTIFGGVWERVKGAFLYAAGDNDPVDTTVRGSNDAVVVEHGHAASGSCADAGAHTHPISATAASNGTHKHLYSYATRSSFTESGSGKTHYSHSGYKSENTVAAGEHTHAVSGTATSNGSHKHTIGVTVNNNGVSGAGKNMPSYRSFYVWRRIS